MRELKFRQPITNRKGDFKGWHYWGIIKEGVFVAPMQNTESNRNDSYQFIGLKDKNGKEIYEGDVCERPYYEDKHNGKFNFEVIYHNLNEEINFLRDLSKIEVIGNIYEGFVKSGGKE